jgi:hypothetical protein
MTALEIAVFAGLWLALLALAGLVLVMYAQVEKAYRHSDAVTAAGLRVGADAPPFDLMVPEGTTPFEFPPEETLHGFVFISHTCQACHELLDELAAKGRPLEACDLAILQGEGGRPQVADRLPEGARWLGLGDDLEAHRRYAVTIFPLAYILRGRTVLAVDTVASVQDIRALHADALENEAELRDRGTPPAEILTHVDR